jgi:hypothetical protein
MMMMMYIVMITMLIIMLSEGLQINNIMKKSMMSSLLAMSIVINPTTSYAVEDSNDVSMTVPSRNVVIKIPDEDLLAKPDPSKQVESIDEVLKLIPSWKYFKIIAKEYSSRSTNYKEGEENLLSPFM